MQPSDEGFYEDDEEQGGQCVPPYGSFADLDCRPCGLFEADVGGCPVVDAFNCIHCILCEP